MSTNRMKRLIIALLVVPIIGGAAHATTWNSIGGLACQLDEGSITYGPQGAGNPLTNDSSIWVCPLGLGTQSSYPRVHDHVAISYIDNNNTSPFSCLVRQTYYGGSIYESATKYTCTNYGGCYDSTTSYTGAGLLLYSTTDLTSSVYNQYVETNFHIQCEVPLRLSGSEMSRILAYWAGEG